ncbi:hypothetical protein TNIN_211811 [Trichonephila inaurata madagascariensis]|uniref:Uncharacterized protein n=1 Tax=Trichonephila inaurata madagascariensis TaxID=2747483 RepID=A0A8X7C0E7_9ARAC|nr:hypothetical protein TNIN_211811 [Trichonephila inaurata madagascariensis]
MGDNAHGGYLGANTACRSQKTPKKLKIMEKERKEERKKKSARKDSIIEGHCGLEFGLRHKFNSSNKTSARSDRSSLQMRDNAYCNGERRILSSFQRARPGMRLIAERISDSMARVREMSEYYANFAHSTRVDDGIKINKKAALAETAMGHGCPVLVGTI